MDDTSPHQAIVADLVAKGASTTGFKRSLTKATNNMVDLKDFRLIPDAFEIAPGLITVYEVEDTHRLDDSKLRAYARVWRALDDVEWEFRLVILDIRGGRLEPSLVEIYFHGPRGIHLPNPASRG